tara:strand:+ start:232 stop:540 length:309 start_codon:yes stop_codon:yes gene_type:complete
MLEFEVKPTEAYRADLVEWLDHNLDDGWGKKFIFFSGSERKEVIDSFIAAFSDDLENYGYQTIRSKYLVCGGTDQFYLKAEYVMACDHKLPSGIQIKFTAIE